MDKENKILIYLFIIGAIIYIVFTTFFPMDFGVKSVYRGDEFENIPYIIKPYIIEDHFESVEARSADIRYKLILESGEDLLRSTYAEADRETVEEEMNEYYDFLVEKLEIIDRERGDGKVYSKSKVEERLKSIYDELINESGK